MELNNLKDLNLPAMLVADLYKKVLIETDTEQMKRPKAQSTLPDGQTASFSFHGSGKNGVVLILDDDNNFESGTKPFLYKMLAACKINPEHIAIIVNRPAPSLQAMESVLKVDKVVLFGTDPSDIRLPINFASFKIQNYGGKSYLHVPGLAMINGDSDAHVANKKELWVSLKKLFNL